jgi:hypothetical protein
MPIVSPQVRLRGLQGVLLSLIDAANWSVTVWWRYNHWVSTLISTMMTNCNHLNNRIVYS